ncbi:MAG TPA: hypothetical protein VMF66_04715 [Candidatus Acidoferrum sp.]|nr:hypothetical protein [Candidatus Acidoferrum sp.]
MIPQTAQKQSSHGAARLSSIEVILPPRLVTGEPATLATLGADHRLVAHVPVELDNGTSVETDATGRANFTAPSGTALIAKAGGGAAATLIDPRSATAQDSMSVPRFAALHSRLNLCGGGFDGNAEANHVVINGEPALVVAASPECLVVIPGANAAPGVAKISVDSATPPREASVTLVALDFNPPDPPLTPGEKGWLVVHARGSDDRLRITVQNESPGVLRFANGDVQELTTSGGRQNVARIQVQAVSSGDFSFNARIVPPPDAEAARRFLQAAEPLAPSDLAHGLKKMEGDLAHHPKSGAKVLVELDRILGATNSGDLWTLLEAARSSL